MNSVVFSSAFQLVDCVALEVIEEMILILCLLCCGIASANKTGETEDELVFVQIVSGVFYYSMNLRDAFIFQFFQVISACRKVHHQDISK